MEGDVVTLQNLFVFDITGEDANGSIIGRHRSTGIARPRFWDRAAYYGQERSARRGAGGIGGSRRPTATRSETTMSDVGDLLSFGAAMLAALAVGALAYAFLYPYLLGDAKGSAPERREEPKGAHRVERARAGGVTAQIGRRHLEGHGEPPEGSARRSSLRLRLERAGLDDNAEDFWLASLVCGAVFALHLDDVAAVSATRTLLPSWLASSAYSVFRAGSLQAHGQTADEVHRELPNAIDIMVRGMKSGLPLNECLAIIARESEEPLAGEFREVIEQQRVGVSLGEALQRLSMRMPLPEVQFLAIVVAIQQQAGGNLSEALGNLSTVLRDRFQLQNEGQSTVRGGQSLGLGPRLRCRRRDVPRLMHDARVHLRLFDTRTGNFALHVLRPLDADGRPGDAQDDQLQVLSSSVGRISAHPRGTGSGNASDRHVHQSDFHRHHSDGDLRLRHGADDHHADAGPRPHEPPHALHGGRARQVARRAARRNERATARASAAERRRKASCSRSSPAQSAQDARYRGAARSPEAGRLARPAAARRLHVLPRRAAATLLRAVFYLFVLGGFGLSAAHQADDGARCGASWASTRRAFSSRTSSRSARQSIKMAFPDALDMLLICVQSGMSVEAAFGKVSKEIGASRWSSPRS